MNREELRDLLAVSTPWAQEGGVAAFTLSLDLLLQDSKVRLKLLEDQKHVLYPLSHTVTAQSSVSWCQLDIS